jgi:TPR repeat protein
MTHGTAKVVHAAVGKVAPIRRSAAGRPALTAGAALMLAVGFMLGANSDRLARSIADGVGGVAFAAPVQDTDAAEAAYRHGDQATALRLALPLAGKGDVHAQSLVGQIYYSGRGGLRDEAQAVKWSRLAADQRHPRAQYNLGLLYATGEGVEQDYRTAHMWFNLAVVHFTASDTRNRNAAIRSRDLTAGKLSREQVAEAQKLAGEWQPSDQAR